MKCELMDLVNDLVDLDVTKVTMFDTGIGLVVIDSLKEKGIEVDVKHKWKRYKN